MLRTIMARVFYPISEWVFYVIAANLCGLAHLFVSRLLAVSGTVVLMLVLIPWVEKSRAGLSRSWGLNVSRPTAVQFALSQAVGLMLFVLTLDLWGLFVAPLWTLAVVLTALTLVAVVSYLRPQDFAEKND